MVHGGVLPVVLQEAGTVGAFSLSVCGTTLVAAVNCGSTFTFSLSRSLSESS